MPHSPRNKHVAFGYLIAALLWAGLAHAQEESRPTVEDQPIPESGQQAGEGEAARQSQQEEAAPENISPALNQIESVIRDLIAQQRAAQGQGPEDHEISDLEAQQGMAHWAKLMFWATLAAVAITFTGIVLIWRTLHHTRRAADYTKGMLEEANKTTKAAIDTVAAMRRSERAYVTMSHKPPGLDITTHIGGAAFRIEIKNSGRTPAAITDVLFQLDWFGPDNPAPEQPVYRTNEPRFQTGAFLVAQAHFTHFNTLPMPGYSDGEGKGEELWFYGYVDYIDEFGDSHRAGYARVFRPDLVKETTPPEERNNLAFVQRHGWNYDVPRPENA